MNRSIFLHHLKTSCYALSAIVLTGWVADALNEGLIFKMILRVFRPNEVERYSHPFSDAASFFIWLIPLLFTILLLLFASVMTLHHAKKPHIYSITKRKTLIYRPHIVGAPSLTTLPLFINTYHAAERCSLLVSESHYHEYDRQLLSLNKRTECDIYVIKERDDLQKITSEMEQWVKKELKNQPSTHQTPLCFDITYAEPVFSSAALFCSLVQDIKLVQKAPDQVLYTYDVVCKVQQ